jgi:hypothetical protein
MNDRADRNTLDLHLVCGSATGRFCTSLGEGWGVVEKFFVRGVFGHGKERFQMAPTKFDMLGRRSGGASFDLQRGKQPSSVVAAGLHLKRQSGV